MGDRVGEIDQLNLISVFQSSWFDQLNLIKFLWSTIFFQLVLINLILIKRIESTNETFFGQSTWPGPPFPRQNHGIIRWDLVNVVVAFLILLLTCTDPNWFLTQKLFWPYIFWDPTFFFKPKCFFYQHFLFTQNFSGSKFHFFFMKFLKATYVPQFVNFFFWLLKFGLFKI